MKKKTGREAKEERWGKRWESVPKPLNEIKAPYKTPLISIVELISPSSSAIMGSSDLNAFFFPLIESRAVCLFAVKVVITVMG